MEKKFNWSKFWWRLLQGFLIFIMNGGIVAWLVMNFYGDTTTIVKMLGIGDVEINVSYWDTLDFKYKAIIYAVIVLGLICSYIFIKFLYKNNREMKVMEKQAKIDDDKQNKALDRIEKIMKGK